MNLQVTLSHMFIKRGFFGLIASTWGFMLGGALLMTVLPHQLALAGLSRSSVTLSQVVMLGMICVAAWVIMELEYQNNTVKKPTDFAAIFLLSAGFAAVIPFIFAVGVIVTWSDEIRHRRAVQSDKLKLRRNLASFLQELMNSSFLKLAH